MEEEELEGCLVEEREELMVSPMGKSAPTLRKAHFLKPPQVSTFTPSRSTSLPQSSVLVPPVFNPPLEPSNVHFTAWGYHKSDWEEWVKHLEPKYRDHWKQAGIYSGIIGSTLTCTRDYELIRGLAEKWSPVTNSFVFPWGEATLTLEDVAILGGYSVLGSPVFPKNKQKEPAVVELAKNLKELAKGAVNYVKKCDWIKEFKASGSDIEHEAFLSMWLHPILFSDRSHRFQIRQFCLATQLAKGERLALAPAVLAGIYRDLSLLKSFGRGDRSKLYIHSQIQLVQLWAWERFPAFQPMRNGSKLGDPRSFMWDTRKPEKVNDVRLALDSAGDTFCWRPYTLEIIGWQLPRFYKDTEGFQNLESDFDLQAFALCLRVSKLVGLNCAQNYYPHRVALQFGFDQDVPSNFVVGEESLEDAWFNYMRPFDDTKMYVPSRFIDAEVTLRYFRWWKQQIISVAPGGPPRFLDDVMHKVVTGKRSSMKRLKRVNGTVTIANTNNTRGASHGYSPNCTIIDIDSDENDKQEVERRVRDANATSGNDLSLADRDGRLCIKGCTTGGVKSEAGEVGESAGASEQIGTSARTASHVCDANIINIESDEDDKLEVERLAHDSNTMAGNNLSVADRDGRLHDKGCTDCGMESTAVEATESALVIGQIGVSAGAASHLIAEKNAKHSRCQNNSNGTAQETTDNTNKPPEPEINTRLARVERELAEIKSMVASKTRKEQLI